MTENYEVFIKELMMIGDLKIRDMTINLLNKLVQLDYLNSTQNIKDQ